MASPEIHFDFIIVGSGFGSLFFLKKLLGLRPNVRVAVVEWGRRNDYNWQLKNKLNSNINIADTHSQPQKQKPWNYTIGLGGGTNCWWGQAMRLLPNDFCMKSKYGVMDDWPFSYEDIEPYYLEAEKIMLISGGDSIGKVSPRSEPYPLPPHRLNSVDEIMMAANPDFHFPIATARAPLPTGQRGVCCATARCNLCPMDAKFTAFNGMSDVLAHESVTYFLESQVRAILHDKNRVTGVTYASVHGDSTLYGDVIVLGANAIHSPAILLRSGLSHPMTGVGLREQLGAEFEILLDGVDCFGGGTVTTSLNYSLYDGPHRRNEGAALLFFENRLKYGLRPEFGRWRQYLPLVVNVEDALSSANKVSIDEKGNAFVDHPAVSDYALAGMKRVERELPRVLDPLPLERIIPRGIRPTESHVQCSLRSGNDPATSVVDAASIHHDVRNLVIVGSSTFTTCPPANPSLTVAAMALRAADLWVNRHH